MNLLYTLKAGGAFKEAKIEEEEEIINIVDQMCEGNYLPREVKVNGEKWHSAAISMLRENYYMRWDEINGFTGIIKMHLKPCNEYIKGEYFNPNRMDMTACKTCGFDRKEHVIWEKRYD